MRVTVVVCLTPPPLPVTVMLYVPGTASRNTLTVIVEVPEPGAGIVAGLKVAVTPGGVPEADKLMALLKPPLIVVVMVEVPAPFWPMTSEDGPAEMVKLPAAAAGIANTRRIRKETTKTALLLRITDSKSRLPGKCNADGGWTSGQKDSTSLLPATHKVEAKVKVNGEDCKPFGGTPRTKVTRCGLLNSALAYSAWLSQCRMFSRNWRSLLSGRFMPNLIPRGST